MDALVKEAIESDCGFGVCALLEKKDPNHLIELLDVASHHSDYTELSYLNAIYILGRWGDERAVSLIESNLPDLNEKGQICALDALGRIGKGVNAKQVGQYGDSKNPDVRKFAMKALSRIGGKAAKQKLEELNAKETIPWVKKIGEKSIQQLSAKH
jgi:HEAT repeat protein